MSFRVTHTTMREKCLLVVPDYCAHCGQTKYPGDIKPGAYTTNEVVALLRKHKHNPEAIQFIADMLEE